MTRTQPTTTWNSRTDTNYLMTQDLDFLMTEDDNYIVLESGFSDYNDWKVRTIPTTSWT